MNDFRSPWQLGALGPVGRRQIYADDQVISKNLENNMMLAMYPNASAVTEKEMSDEIEDLPYVKSVTSMSIPFRRGIPEEFLPYSVTSELHQKDYYKDAYLHTDQDESDQAFKGADEIQDILERYYPRNSYLVGNTFHTGYKDYDCSG